MIKFIIKFMIKFISAVVGRLRSITSSVIKFIDWAAFFSSAPAQAGEPRQRRAPDRRPPAS